MHSREGKCYRRDRGRCPEQTPQREAERRDFSGPASRTPRIVSRRGTSLVWPAPATSKEIPDQATQQMSTTGHAGANNRMATDCSSCHRTCAASGINWVFCAPARRNWRSSMSSPGWKRGWMTHSTRQSWSLRSRVTPGSGGTGRPTPVAWRAPSDRPFVRSDARI